MKTLFDKLNAALRDRSDWEERQKIWYDLRFTGLGRRAKEPWQADMHWPLIDEQIEKLRPYYVAQIFGQDRLASFTSVQNQVPAIAESAQDYFDWHVKQHPSLDRNAQFEKTMFAVIDSMVLNGIGVLKVSWETEFEHLRWDSVAPGELIVPKCRTLVEADYFAHVITLTTQQYLADTRFVHDPNVLNRIKGKGNEQQNSGTRDQNRVEREGLTYCNDEDAIIVWECYEKTPSGWLVSTFCPLAPEIPLRRPYLLVDKWNNHVFLPFIGFPMEITDAGWYSSRGLAERQAPFQQYLEKLWNSKVDCMSFWNAPLFTTEGQTVNASNMTLQPGDIWPGNVTPMQMPSPPFSFDQEMQQTRQIASETISMPDAGVAEPLKGSGKNNGYPTATEVEYRRVLSQTGIDLKGRTFRLSLGEAYRKGWALLATRKPQDLSYFVAGQTKILQPEVMQSLFLIEPAGSPDSWNRSIKLQRSFTRLQAFQGNPMVDQAKLVRDVLDADDPRLVNELFKGEQQTNIDEQENEATELVLMRDRFPVQAQPNEDHAARIQIIFGKLQQLQAEGMPIDPAFKQLLLAHLAQHFQFLAQQNPKLARQVLQAVQSLEGSQGSPTAPASQPMGAMQ